MITYRHCEPGAHWWIRRERALPDEAGAYCAYCEAVGDASMADSNGLRLYGADEAQARRQTARWQRNGTGRPHTAKQGPAPRKV